MSGDEEDFKKLFKPIVTIAKLAFGLISLVFILFVLYWVFQFIWGLLTWLYPWGYILLFLLVLLLVLLDAANSLRICRHFLSEIDSELKSNRRNSF